MVLCILAPPDNGCLISLLAPRKKRPCVGVGGIAVKATRVVISAHIGRPIEADEDVHHAKCRSVRCVEPSHLQVIPTAAHRAHQPRKDASSSAHATAQSTTETARGARTAVNARLRHRPATAATTRTSNVHH
jgi:hypothetical protein